MYFVMVCFLDPRKNGSSRESVIDFFFKKRLKNNIYFSSGNIIHNDQLLWVK